MSFDFDFDLYLAYLPAGLIDWLRLVGWWAVVEVCRNASWPHLAFLSVILLAFFVSGRKRTMRLYLGCWAEAWIEGMWVYPRNGRNVSKGFLYWGGGRGGGGGGGRGRIYWTPLLVVVSLLVLIVLRDVSKVVFGEILKEEEGGVPDSQRNLAIDRWLLCLCLPLLRVCIWLLFLWP